ncbi:MAG: hypothetical protein KF842_06895 [Caulobacter sp.]|nr:hypothetical protein [Caulobacter sp.]
MNTTPVEDALAPVWLRQAIGRGLARIARARHRAWMDAGQPVSLTEWRRAHPIPGDAGWTPAQTPRLNPPVDWTAMLSAVGAARLAALGISPAPPPAEVRP